MSGTQWNSRTVTDVVGAAGSIVLTDESTAQRDLEDWLHDYYEIDDDEAECLSEHLCAPVLTDEALAGAWWRCGDEGEGWIADEADVEIAAEYLRAVSHEN